MYGQKVKVTEIKTQCSSFRTITPVWIHISWWNDVQSLMLLRSGALLFFKVICQIWRSPSSKSLILTEIGRFRTITAVWIYLWLRNDAQSLKYRRGALLFLAATKQLYDWFSPSVRPSVCLSVRPSHLFLHVPIIASSWNFELLPWSEVMSMQKIKVRGQRSRSQRSTSNLSVSGL